MHSLTFTDFPLQKSCALGKFHYWSVHPFTHSSINRSLSFSPGALYSRKVTLDGEEVSLQIQDTPCVALQVTHWNRDTAAMFPSSQSFHVFIKTLRAKICVGNVFVSTVHNLQAHQTAREDLLDTVAEARFDYQHSLSRLSHKCLCMFSGNSLGAKHT